MAKEERRLQAEITGLLEEVGGDELPEELKRREDRLAAIREAKARLEAEQRAKDDARGRKPGQCPRVTKADCGLVVDAFLERCEGCAGAR